MSTTATIPQAPPRDALIALLQRDPIPLAELAGFLDALEAVDRCFAARSIPAKLQAKLYDAAAASAPLPLDHFVPAGRGALEPVRHFGRNSLPAFRLFEKRFCRPAATEAVTAAPANGDGQRLWGYNHQPMSWLVGPGSFVVYAGPTGEPWIDYREIPPAGPAGWPPPRANGRGFASLVYGGMVDRMRRVSEHVSIGRAHRGEKAMNAWFVLCREA